MDPFEDIVAFMVDKQIPVSVSLMRRFDELVEDGFDDGLDDETLSDELRSLCVG